MEQIELEKFVQKAIADIETGVETEKRGGETDKIGDPLPGEKIRWKAPTETGHAKTAIDKPVLILIGSLIFTPIFDSKDKYSPPEQTHTSESPPAEPPPPINFGIQTSASSLSANEAKKLIETFNKLRRNFDKTGETP